LTREQQRGSFPHGIWTGIAMAEDTMPQDLPPKSNGGGPEDLAPEDLAAEDLDSVADRLEAALERIERRLETAKPNRPSAELTARLDGLIERLREALGGSHLGNPGAGGGPDGSRNQAGASE